MSVYSQFAGTAGGSFVAPNAPFPGYVANYWYPPAIPFYMMDQMRQATVDRLYTLPFVAQDTHTFTGLSVQQTSTTTGNVRLGIYNSTGGVPSSLLRDFGVVSFPASTGIRTGTGGAPAAVVKGGLYFLVAVFDTTIMQYVGMSDNDSAMNHPYYSNFGIVSTATTLNVGNSGYYVSQTYGALPDPYPAGTKTYDGNVPFLCLRG